MDIKTQKYCINSKKWCVGGLIGALFSILAIFFIVPFFEKNFYTHLLLQGSFTLLILSTIYTIEKQKSLLLIGLISVVPLIFYFDSLSFYYHSISYMIAAYGFSLIFTLLAIIVLMNRILQARLVNAQLVFGALMVYLLAGILWGNFYFIENIIFPESFHGEGGLNLVHTAFHNTYEQQSNFLYYSFATLATLGMGDITPLTHLAKSLTAMEAMFGQLFVAIIIAKLVSVWWHVPVAK